VSASPKWPWSRRRVPAARDDALAVEAKEAGPYADFRVLLDNPAPSPGVGFDDYVEALRDVIVHSRAEFAVGIFGSWGSGKTTLMRAIQKRLGSEQNVVPVWFAAWRYEKDPNLILPLLDVLRESLERESDGKPGWAREAAVAIGRAGLAFLEGLKLSASLPGVGADLELGKMIDAIKSRRGRSAPLSRYHEGFRMLSGAIEELSAGGTRRVVVFIDDLDRCLPANALDVLESMKLFFDVEGCIFVVGLDQEIVEKAVAVKYAPAFGEGAQPSGAEYVKKMFQVPFTLPSIETQQLQKYLDAIEQDSDFSDAQRRDFTDHVRPHFWWLQGGDSINPREIKRFINIYVLQLKMLSQRLGNSVKPEVVLALLCMNFRPGWHQFYERLAAEPDYFQTTMQDELDRAAQPEAVYLAGTKLPLPAELTEYLRGLASAVLTVEDLQAYVTTAESTWTTDPWVLEARTEVNRLRRAGDEFVASLIPPGDIPPSDAVPGIAGHIDTIAGHVDTLYGLISTRHESSGRLGVLQERLEAAVSSLLATARQLVVGQGQMSDDTLAVRWMSEAVPQIDALDAGLLDWHRYLSIGP
jgi:KAP family P-loop domain